MITLQSLPAPDSLQRYRSERYLGEERGMRLEEFPESDRALLLRLYAGLRATLYAAQTGLQERTPLRTMEMIRRAGWKPMMNRFMAQFGTHRPVPEGDAHALQRIREVYHDLRGGALSVTHMRIELGLMKGTEADLDDVHGIFYASRDQLKIMRNCIVDLDPPRRQRDLEHHLHSTELLREKWAGVKTATLQIEYVSNFDGAISSCCLEFSSLERVLYNLLNNAAQHSRDGGLRFFVRRYDSAPRSDNVQFAVANLVKHNEYAALVDRFGDDLRGLFEGGFTIGGSGVGLKVVAETVANAYGLTSAAAAIDEGHVGARLIGEEIVVWAHWPVME